MGKRCYPWVFLGIKNNIQSNRMFERLIDRFDKKIDGGKGKMKITTAKEFMKVIAKHYEKCKEIYLHTC